MTNVCIYYKLQLCSTNCLRMDGHGETINVSSGLLNPKNRSIDLEV